MGLVHSRISAVFKNMKSNEIVIGDTAPPIRQSRVRIESGAPETPVSTSPTRQPCVSLRPVSTSSSCRPRSSIENTLACHVHTSSIRRPYVSIESLPQELLLHVFSFLSLIDLCDAVSKVCKHWNTLHQDPHLYSSLELREGRGSTQTVIKLLRQAPRLKALTLVDRSDMKAILEEVCKRNYQIRVLVLKKLEGSYRINASIMKRIIQNCTELHTLKLHGCYVRGEVFYKNLSLKLPHLRTVHFVHGRKFSSGAMLYLVNSCVDLQDLRIYNNYSRLGDYMDIPDAEIISLCERFCKTIRSMKLDFGVWSPDAFAALKKCDQLEDLGILEAHSMSCEGLLVIGSMASLRHLEITCCSVPEVIWIQMFSAPALTSLLSLILCRCNTTNRVAATIGAHLKNLQVLGMSGRLARHPQAAESVSLRGVESVIKGCAKLTGLELLYMDSTVQGAILLIPKYLPGLKKLFIFQESISRWNTVSQVETEMPDLVAEYFNN